MEAGMSGNFTNQSFRAYMAMTLYHDGALENLLLQSNPTLVLKPSNTCYK